MIKGIKRFIKKILRILPDKMYIQIFYFVRFKKRINLKNPKTFNEKINWLKLNDRKDIYTTMVDKYAVKEYVKNIIGEEYIIPTLGIYDNFDDIDFTSLPNQFVIKCTHDSGGIVIVKDKSGLDIEKTKKKINQCLKLNYYYSSREWPYKNVKPQIMIEPYLEDTRKQELIDYKFFSFSGKTEYVFIATNRQGKGSTYFDFFDINFNHLDVTNGHFMNPVTPEKPINYSKMIELSQQLSKDLPHVRVDFYEVDGKVYFGELTLYHNGGLVPFIPNEYDIRLGDCINLNSMIEKKKQGES